MKKYIYFNRKIILKKVREHMISLRSENSKESVVKLIVNDCKIVDQSDMAERCNIFFAQLRQPSNLNFPGYFLTKDMQTPPPPQKLPS